MADRYNNINNTSPFVSALKNDKPNVPRSNFDYSRSHHGNMNIGTLEILDCFPTQPNSDYTISEDLLLKVRVSMKKRIMTGQRVYVHAWYMSLNDLWEAAQNHIDHGRSGILDIKKPSFDGYLKYYDDEQQAHYVFDTLTPNSPANQIGVPVRRIPFKRQDNTDIDPINSYVPASLYTDDNNIVVQNYYTRFNALPLAMFQRIYIDKYSPKNLIQNNKNALPDNAEKIRIGYNIEDICALDSTGGISEFDLVNTYNNIIDDPNSTFFILGDKIAESDNYPPVYLNHKRYRQKKGDYFVCSSPFADLLRGDAPTINLTGLDATIDFKDVFTSVQSLPDMSDVNQAAYFYLGENPNILGIPIDNPGSMSNTDIKEKFIEALNKAKISGNVQTRVTASMIQTLLALTLIKQRNSLTNGDYNEMVKAQFGYSPNVDDYSAKYIGGFYQDIVFSDVTQTSISEVNSPLGNQAGQAMSANSGFIGKFHSNDWGYIMVIASIVPDEIYNQGIPRFLGELSSDAEYFSPILNNLPPQAIKNKEIYLTHSDSTNEDVFSYTQQFEHLRHRENYASGFVGLGSLIAAEDSSYVQHKRFSDSPQFNAKFVSLCPDNVDMSPYSVTNEPPYIFTVINNVDKVEPLPYDSMPSDLGLKYA